MNGRHFGFSPMWASVGLFISGVTSATGKDISVLPQTSATFMPRSVRYNFSVGPGFGYRTMKASIFV
jgi:hypothetical protein